MIRGELAERLPKYIGGIVSGLGGHLVAANGPPDHVHLAVILPPQGAQMDSVRAVKAGSSKWIHQTFPGLEKFAWQDGYAAFTVSHSGLPRLVEYIERQREHHKKLGFREELVALLKRHGIEYDERYVVG